MRNQYIQLVRRSPFYWRVTFNHPPLNIFGPETIPQLEAIIKSLESDEKVKVVVFDSAVEGFFLTHYDFLAKLEDSTALPAGRGCRRYPICSCGSVAPVIRDTKHLVNVASLPSDADIAPEWDAFIASVPRPSTQARIRKLMERGFHKPGDVESRLGHYVGQLGT